MSAIPSHSANSLYALEAERELAYRRAERQNGRNGSLAVEQAESAVWQGEKDEVNISSAAKSLFSTYQSAALSSGNESPQASMRAMTRHGSVLTLDVAARSTPQFSLAQFGERNSKEPMFSLAGKDKAAELVYTLKVESPDGSLAQYELKGNSRLTEDKAGNIRMMDAKASSLQGDDGQDILININGSEVHGGGGDDIIFNLAEQARVSGGDGNDVITSMGNGTSLDGGAGDDAVAALHDSLRAFTEDLRINEKGETYVVGRPRNYQQVDIQGGDGNDALLAQTGLYKSSVSGGAGMDSVQLGDVLESTVDGGDGSDEISAHAFVKSSMHGGAGNDTIQLLNGLENSRVQGGAGEDDITIRGKLENAVVDGGSDSDLIEVLDGTVSEAKITGGSGDDLIHISGQVGNSNIDAGSGDDFMWLESGAQGNGRGSTRINGGEGDDTMYLGPLSGTFVDGGEGENQIRIEQAASLLERSKKAYHTASSQ